MGAVTDRVSVNGVELEFDSVGGGEAVVFIHGVGVADSGLPLAVEPVLRDHYRVVRYRRRGYAGSTPIHAPVSIAEHAQDCRGLLDALDVRQAHVVGHSYGAFVALQLAADSPGVVSSLALFEPPLLAVINPQQFFEARAAFAEKCRAGDRRAAVDGFFCKVLGPDWRAEVSHTVPGGPEQAEQDAATLFDSDLLSVQEWRFGAEEAARIAQPVLFLAGAKSSPGAVTTVRDLLHTWLPRTEDDVMPGANHLLHIRHPADAAARLAAFLKRHAIAG